jgi:hypothetical protein
VILSLGRATTQSGEKFHFFERFRRSGTWGRSGYAEVGLGGAAVSPKWDLGVHRGPLAPPLAPPRTLVSPTGVQYHVLNLAELDALADAEGDGDGLKDDLHKLVGLRVHSKSATQLPQHRRQWQLLDRVRWLERTDSGALLPIIGDAAHFVKRFTLQDPQNYSGGPQTANTTHNLNR